MKKYLVLLLLLNATCSIAQDSLFIRRQIETLCSPNFSGRGYVDSGVQKAGRYIASQFLDFGLQPIAGDTYFQNFTFSVNSFPDRLSLQYKNHIKKPGVDYLIDAYSPAVFNKKFTIKIIDADTVTTVEGWNKLLLHCKNKKKAYVVLNIDSLQKKLAWRPRQIASSLPEGVFIFPKKAKPLWWPGTDVNKAVVVYWFDSFETITNRNKVRLQIDQQFTKEMPCQNVVGIVKGEVDSYIVFTAHYDHLGMMGKDAMFPGASDNASGTSMLLSLAQYFSQHSQRYTMLFIAFAGEEAGLIGSKYFVKNPLIDLKKIRFLVNTDIMGDATDGIAVINGKNQEHEFNIINNLNPILTSNSSDTAFLFKEIRKGDGSNNSDHYPFVEAGVPAVFIHSMGGKGFYHDTWDKPESLSLNNIAAVRQLLIQLAEKLQ